MTINLDGIVLHDVEILVIPRDAIFITSKNQNLLKQALDLPLFQTSSLSSNRVFIYTCSTDAIAVAERIAISWENEGFKINRIFCNVGNYIPVQSFILA